MRLLNHALVFAFAAVLCAPGAHAADHYRVDAGGSRVSFVSVKEGNVPVPGGFSRLDGQIDIDPKAGTVGGRVVVDVASLNTGNPARDQNILTAFFEVAASGSSATLIPTAVRGDLSALRRAGGYGTFDLDADLTLHGATVPLTIPLTAFRGRDGSIVASTRAPITIRFADFGMTPQAEALKALCGHSDLSGLANIDVELGLVPANR